MVEIFCFIDHVIRLAGIEPIQAAQRGFVESYWIELIGYTLFRVHGTQVQCDRTLGGFAEHNSDTDEFMY